MTVWGVGGGRGPAPTHTLSLLQARTLKQAWMYKDRQSCFLLHFLNSSKQVTRISDTVVALKKKKKKKKEEAIFKKQGLGLGKSKSRKYLYLC